MEFQEPLVSDNLPLTAPHKATFLFSPVLIVGFHHSGTRLLAKLLHEMGVFQVVDRKTYEWGYIQDLNSSLLPDWHLPEAVRSYDAHKGSFQISALEIADRLKHCRYNSNQPWGHKDPRTCATLSSWLEVFPDARVVHIVRDPLDVLGTLPPTYSKFTPDGKTPQQALSYWGDLWLAYMERIQQAASSANIYVEIKFEDLCAQPHTELEKLTRTLELPKLRSADITGINPHKIGIYKTWIQEGRHDVKAVEHLKVMLKEYLIRYGYDDAAQFESRFEVDPASNPEKALAPDV